MSATTTDELVSAARDLAALLRDNYMLPNTWPASRRFLAAVEALDGPTAADGPQTSSQSSAPDADMIVGGLPSPVVATLAAPADPLPQDKPERQSRAPLS